MTKAIDLIARASAEVAAAQVRADHAERQRDNLAYALRDLLDAHYHWRAHGEGKEGVAAEEAAQRFIDARSVAQAALTLDPSQVEATGRAVHGRVIDAARQAFAHVSDHEHEHVSKQDHFFGTLMEQLGIDLTSLQG